MTYFTEGGWGTWLGWRYALLSSSPTPANQLKTSTFALEFRLNVGNCMFIVAIRQHDNVSDPILGICVLIFSSQSEIICEAKVFGYTKLLCTQKTQYANVRLGASFI